MSRIVKCLFIVLASFLSIDHATASPHCAPDCPEPEPDPTPPPPTEPYQYEARNSGSIGNSVLGGQYSAALSVYATRDGATLRARGTAFGSATLLGNTFASLASVSGVVTSSNVFQIQSTMFAAGQQVYDFTTTLNSPFTNAGFTGHYRHEFWHYSNSWLFLGVGVHIQLALDGGGDLLGTATAQPLYATASLNPRLFIDAGGSLSAQFLWMDVGVLAGSVHLLDATLSGTGTLDARAIPSQGPIAYSVGGGANLCTLGGEIHGCIIAQCGTLVSWNSICPGFLSLSGQRSGTF
jgi:hypothetical protein